MRDAGSKGFTLLELIVTLAIAGFLFVMIVPVGRHQGHRELERAARDVAAALRLAREHAIIANAPAAVTIDLANGFYRGDGAARPAALPRGAEVRLVTTEEERLGNRIGRVRFYPDGSASGGGVILTRNGERVAVLVDWLTGAVSIRSQ